MIIRLAVTMGVSTARNLPDLTSIRLPHIRGERSNRAAGRIAREPWGR